MFPGGNCLIAEVDARPVGFVEIIDPAEEPVVKFGTAGYPTEKAL